ncbi:MAG TPA: PIN domain-containing protein [Gemmatimonadales bacterium]|nr:PIN domain-containing protein [Gemmatimonadales bacterium]
MRVLADTSGLLGLNRPEDRHHAQAVRIAERHKSSGGRYLGTTLVLGEFHAHLLRRRGPAYAREVLVTLLEDSDHEWAPVDEALIRDVATNWLARFPDQPFSLVDAVSFEVMRQQKLTHAFAFDRHFELAGFRLLR